MRLVCIWLAILAIIVGVEAIMTKKLSNQEQSASKSRSASSAPSRPAVQWRNPVSAKEHLVLFAAMAEAVTAFDRPATWVSVSWAWGTKQKETVELCFMNADDLSLYANSAPGRYLQSMMGQDRHVKRSFSFEGSSSGAPTCFRGEKELLDFIRPFAPHAYIEPSMSGHDGSYKDGVMYSRDRFCLAFRQHTSFDLPGYKPSDACGSLESLIVRHYNS